MAEWREVSSSQWCLVAGDSRISVWESLIRPGEYSVFIKTLESSRRVKLEATNSEAAKAEAVALFRAKLEAALKEIEGL